MSVEEKKAIVAVFDAPGMTSEQYDQIISGLEAAGEGSPQGRLYHVAASTPGGWLVMDVWESIELFERFAKTLVPIIQQAGVTPPQPQVYQVYNIVK